MPYTVRNLVESSLRLIQVLAEGETATGTQALDGLRALNEMTDWWNIQEHALTYTQSVKFPTTVGKAEYTLGDGSQLTPPVVADVPTFRPAKITNAVYRYGGVDYTLVMLTERDYQDITLKSNPGFPDSFSFEAQFPVGILRLYPVPDAGGEVILSGYSSIRQVTLDTDTALFAPGYTRAIRFNLAKDLALEYGRDFSAALQQEAAQALGVVKSNNLMTSALRLDLPVGASRARRSLLLGD